MKRINEREHLVAETLDSGSDAIWQAMQDCIEKRLLAEGTLPGGLNLPCRAKALHRQ